MTGRAHVMAIVGTVVVVAVILRLVNLRQLRSKYALLWLSIAGMLSVLAAVPTITDTLSRWFGLHDGTTLFFVSAIGFLFLVVVHFSWELSRLEMRTRVLAEELALLRDGGDPSEADPTP
jgi:hypothetical protein